MIIHRPVWWAYGDDGLPVCFQDGMLSQVNGEYGDAPLSSLTPPVVGRRKKVGIEQWFELDAEVYPLTIMSTYDMLLRETQGRVLNQVSLNGAPMSSHMTQVKRLPILHTLLRHLWVKPVSNERLEDACF